MTDCLSNKSCKVHLQILVFAKNGLASVGFRWWWCHRTTTTQPQPTNKKSKKLNWSSSQEVWCRKNSNDEMLLRRHGTEEASAPPNPVALGSNHSSLISITLVLRLSRQHSNPSIVTQEQKSLLHQQHPLVNRFSCSRRCLFQPLFAPGRAA